MSCVIFNAIIAVIFRDFRVFSQLSVKNHALLGTSHLVGSFPFELGWQKGFNLVGFFIWDLKMGGCSRASQSFETVYTLSAIRAEMQNKSVDYLTAVKILQGSFVYDRTKFGYVKLEGRGSRIRFVNMEKQSVVELHRPHPNNTIKTYVKNEIIRELTTQGFIKK
jgi:hypothetical protein